MPVILIRTLRKVVRMLRSIPLHYSETTLEALQQHHSALPRKKAVRHSCPQPTVQAPRVRPLISPVLGWAMHM